MKSANPYRYFDTRSLIAAREVQLWDLADIADNPAGWDYAESSRDFLTWQLAMSDQELQRRQGLRNRPLAPAWPDGRAELAAIKQAITLETLVERLARVELVRRGRRVWCCCPLPGHEDDGTASFAIQPEKQLFYCYGCNRGGDVFTFAELYRDSSFHGAVGVVCDVAGIKRPIAAQSQKPGEVITFPSGATFMPVPKERQRVG